MPVRASLLVAVALLGSCGGSPAQVATAWDPGDLLVLDADAGPPDDDGEPRGVLFRAPRSGRGGAVAAVSDPRWRDPVALAVGPDDALYVVESTGAHRGPDDPARGAVFRVSRNGDVALAWTHPDLRQPVHISVDTERDRAFVTDRAADPLGLARPTGAVFVVDVDADGAWSPGRAVGDARLVTPAATRPDGRGGAWVLEADANPDGHAGTPGMLLRLAVDGEVPGLTEVVRFVDTTSPIAFAGPWIVDANHARAGARIGAGALLAWDAASGTARVAVTHEAFPPRTFVDPTGAVALPDGRLALADANADPLRLGGDGLGRGVYGSGRGCVLALDPAADVPRGEVLVASERFVTPIAVAVAPPLSE